MLTIKGTTYGIVIDSSTRLDGTEIFLAIPKGNRLKSKHTLGYSVSGDSLRKTDGDFSITFLVKKNTNLYFNEGKNYYLLEYKISDLIGGIKDDEASFKKTR